MRRRDLILGAASLASSRAFASLPFGAKGQVSHPILGVYPFPVSTNPSQGVSAINSWLGRNIQFTHGYVASSSWSSFSAFTVNNYGVIPYVSVPLTVTGTSLATVNTGANDSNFTTVATTLAAAGITRVRLGWEFNYNGWPWSANTPSAPNSQTSTDYITAFQRVVGLFRAVSTSFRFCWCSNSPQGNGSGGYVDPSACYPGDSYVDCIGQDVYFNSASGTSNPPGLFGFFQGASFFGMDWMAGFARTHGKQISIDEWGVNTDAFAGLVIQMAEWIRANQVTYHGYWMSNQGSFSGDLSGNQYPNSATNFIQEFR